MPVLSSDEGLGWPKERTSRNGEYASDWLHSDFKDIALPYVYPMYEKMLEIGQLTEATTP